MIHYMVFAIEPGAETLAAGPIAGAAEVKSQLICQQLHQFGSHMGVPEEYTILPYQANLSVCWRIG